MGIAKYDKTKKKLIIPAIIGDLYLALDKNAKRDGTSTKIEVTIKGKSEETIIFEIDNVQELLDILKYNADI